MKKRRGLADRGYSRKVRNQAVPFLERVEDRVLMATFTVTSTTDSLLATANDGTLRGEILGSNATTTANVIDFNLPAQQNTITLVGSLPAITNTATIQGTTGTGTDGQTIPVIQITEDGNSTIGPAFTVQSSATQIRNLIIDNIKGDAIDLNGGSGGVAGCWIGLDPNGTALARNSGVGIAVSSPFNVIGDITTNPNVISGNSYAIQVIGNIASRNTIIHNFIGTTVDGLHVLTTTPALNGIDLETPNNTIGGVSANGPLGLGNLISGVANPLTISSQGNFNLIQGNYIGSDVTGLIPLGNRSPGINLFSVSSNTIGGTATGAGNVVGANAPYGIEIQGSNTNQATLNSIRGNMIGVGADKITPMGNTLDGVFINGASGNVVGGTVLQGSDPSFGNFIEFNGSTTLPGSAGVYLFGGQNNGILSNSIYQNGGPGIVLNGANSGVQPPTLISAQATTGFTRITGTYVGNQNTNYRIQFFYSQTANLSGFGDGQNLLGDLDIKTDSTGKYSFDHTFLMGAPVGSFISATATQGVLVTNNTSQFAADISATQAAVTDLKVDTATSLPTPLLNQPYTFTLTVTNNGPNDATGVVLTDVIPTNSTFVSSSGGTFANGTVTDNIGSIASGASVMVTITVTPNALGQFVNTATVTGNELDTMPTNNKSETGVDPRVNVAPDADVAVTLTPSATNVAIGSPLTYVLTVSNSGPSTATSTMVTIQFPANFAGIIVMPDQGSYTINPDNSVTLNLGIIPSGSASTTQLSATPSSIGPATTTATVFAMLDDPNPNNNSASAVVTVANAADLGITLTADPNPVLIGNELFFTAIVTNNGPSVATSPVVLDALPAGLTFDSTNSSVLNNNGRISASGGLVTASLNALNPGDSDTIIIAVFPTISGQFSNTVTVGDPDEVTPQELDTDLTNNIASTLIQVSPADISVVVNNPADPLFIGSNAVYQIVVTNNGPATADNVILSDVFSGAVTIIGSSFGTASGNALNVNLGSLAANQSITVSLIVDPTGSGLLINSASVTSDEFDIDPNNNTSSSSNVVSPADLAVSVTGSPNPVLTGQSLTYLVVITNNGPATATNVLFTNIIPNGTILNGVTSTQGTVAPSALNTLSGNLGSIASGASVTVIISLSSPTIQFATDSASVTSDNLDPNTDNNSGSSTVPVVNVAGTIQLDQANLVVAENAGSVTLLVNRVGGTLGTVSATYTTQNYTAVAGVNYVASAGVVTFLDGQTSALITIPILDDFRVDGNLGFFVVLSGPTGGSSIGSPSETGITVVNTDRDLVPPAVSSLVAVPNGTSIGGFILTFDKPLNPTLASLTANFHIFLTNNGNAQQNIPIAYAIYNPFNDTVTLVPTAPLPSNRFYRIVANGSTGQPIEDTSGNVLYGSTGPHTNYDVFYGQGTKLVYNDANNNVVTINLTGGGTMAIFRAANGEAEVINLLGIVPHKSKLSGSVKKRDKHASGSTLIGAINGFGQFGNVKSSLTTPAFYVGSAPVTSSNVRAKSLVSNLIAVSATSSNVHSASLVSNTVSVPGEVDSTASKVVHKKVTPRGPQHTKR